MPSHRRIPQPGQGPRTARVTVLTAAAATAAAVAGAASAPSAQARPADNATDVATRIDHLYEQAERATEQFNAAKERSEQLRGQVEVLQDRAARGQERVNGLRNDLGMLAGAQYRSGGVDPTLALLLSPDPGTYLDRAATLDRISSRGNARLGELRDAQRVLDQERMQAAGRLVELERARTTLNARKKTVQRKLMAAARLVNSLSDEERAQLASRLEQRASRSGRLIDIPDLAASSARAAAAVSAVRSVVGAPYAWGSTGPGAFDCSGLMVWAYRQAGVGLPRTSQAQLHAGRQVPLSQARPGDLVVYRGDASHVGMYVGGGQVVHAPYPGARVRYDPIGMMPVAAVTRPA
ncbi:NlpC/P60 family protein [Streptomyces sp. NPDC088732]|uniref:C40 family peptidase n=1 Tax=Streptomyces sp. NPDC088732 TaxID=3365879 RepID=UPI003808E285